MDDKQTDVAASAIELRLVQVRPFHGVRAHVDGFGPVRLVLHRVKEELFAPAAVLVGWANGLAAEHEAGRVRFTWNHDHL